MLLICSCSNGLGGLRSTPTPKASPPASAATTPAPAPPAPTPYPAIMISQGTVIVVLAGPQAQAAVADLVTWGHSVGAEFSYFNGSWQLGPMTEVEADEVPELTYSVLEPSGANLYTTHDHDIATQLAQSFGTSGTIVTDPFGLVQQSERCQPNQVCTLTPSPAAVQPGED